MRTVLCAIAATGLALGGALPADAVQLHDVNMDAVTQVRSISGTDGAENTMPGNPEAELPDTIAQSIPDDAEVVSEDHALTADGTLKDLATGKTITDPNLVGTQSSQPDPLAKTDGASFIPVEVDAVRTEIENASKAQSDASLSAETARSKATVRLASLPNNEYGAYWGTYNGTPAFFEGNGSLFVQQAKGVIDVSEWQGDIDWQTVKNAGVEGAIIRISYGWGNGYDKKALRNISECKRLGIPFGIYMYSYAENSGNAASEGADVASLLRKAGVNPNDLQYPVYYDLEAWSWTGHAHPTSPAVYDGIVNAWFSQLRNAGYSNLAVYSYTSYLNNELNSSDIHAKTRWVAQYGSRMGYTAWSSNDRGWQYSSSAHINGISGSVDVNAFGGKQKTNSTQTSVDVRALPAITVPDGNYYINVRSKVASSIDIPGASTADSTAIQLYSGNGSKAQQFRFIKQPDGSYSITNVNSGKALDVRNGSAGNNAVVQQYSTNGTNAQHWFIRDSGTGYYLQSALGNWVLDVSGGSTANGAAIHLYAPNGTVAQLFVLSSSEVSIPANTSTTIRSVKNNGLVFDVPGASTANSARIQLYASNGSNAQKYLFTTIGNAAYRITNVNSGKALDVCGGSAANGAALQQYDGNNSVAQQWTVRNYGSGRVALVSVNANKAVDIPGGNAAQQVKLQMYTPNGTAAQQWTINKVSTPRERMNAAADSHRKDLPDGTYMFGSKLKTSMKIDVAGASKSNGINVRLWNGNGTNAQKWKVTHDSNGYVTLTNVNSGKVLDVYGGSSANGANVQQYSSNNTYAQKWIAVKHSDGSYTFQSALAENKVLDVSGASTSNGANG
ncbi:RICIN domain-containing protein [Bifidobacterium pongonis]|uniref:RICIN domain-containing protein n=1 Tax=Bifidobacterium pongonis TaxID=2834432 RepID=UPI003B834B99